MVRGRKWALPVLCGSYVVCVLACSGLLLTMTDRWWPATLLAFGPRWPLVVPALPLVALAWWRGRRRWAAITALAGLVVLGPYMGFCAALWRSHAAAPGAGLKLSVASYNVQELRITDKATEKVVAELDVDILVLEECRSARAGISKLYGYHVATVLGLCLFSRFPILELKGRDPKDVWARNGTGAIMRVVIDLDGHPINVVALHLSTIRDGLEAIRYDRLAGVPRLRSNMALRRWHSQVARQWADEASGPLLVMGDLNMPVESDIYRSHWSHLVNVFDECGTGYGHTKHTSLYSIRIDHILMSEAFRCSSVQVGQQTSSDHAPVRADLTLFSY